MENKKILNNIDHIRQTIINSLVIFSGMVEYHPYDEEKSLIKYMEETEKILKP